MVDKPIVHSVAGMDQIVRLNDLFYSYGGAGNLADLYLPSTQHGARRHAVVVFIRGGVPQAMISAGFKVKDSGAFVSWGRLVAASGMAAITFNHRLHWENGFVQSSLNAAREDLGMTATCRDGSEVEGEPRGAESPRPRQNGPCTLCNCAKLL